MLPITHRIKHYLVRPYFIVIQLVYLDDSLNVDEELEGKPHLTITVHTEQGAAYNTVILLDDPSLTEDFYTNIDGQTLTDIINDIVKKPDQESCFIKAPTNLQ